MDLRSERTIKWIEDTFVELTLTEGFSRVTVSEIANKAQINRKTFYAHYLDKYDLAQKLAVQVLKRYKLLLDQRLIGTNIRLNSLIDSFLKKKENVRLLKALFTIHTEEFDFEEEFSKLLVSQLKKHAKVTDPLEIEILVNIAITTGKYYLNSEESFSVDRQTGIIRSIQKLI